MVQDINLAVRSYSLISSPANSLKRLQLNYNNDSVLISPVREAEFLVHIKTLNPRFKVPNLNI